MNDIDYHRVTLDKDINAEEFIGGITDGSWQTFEEVNFMSVANTTFQDLQTKDDVKIDCEKIQRKIPEIREVYYKKDPDEIKLFIFFDETEFSIRSKIFDEIVGLRSKYKSHFVFRVFTLDIDRDVIESGMEKLI